MKHPFFESEAETKIFAHRGYLSQKDTEKGFKENTRPAFMSALEAGARFIETDCQVSLDGEMVLFHDADLKRLTGHKQLIKDVSFAQLQDIMEPHGGILKLEDALEQFPKARFNIDVKNSSAASLIGQTAAAHSKRVLLTSFSDRRRLEALKQTSKHIKSASDMPATSGGMSFMTKLLFAHRLKSFQTVKNLLKTVDAIQIPERFGKLKVLDKNLIKVTKANNVEVHVWTVNERKKVEELFELQVDGIITDETEMAVACYQNSVNG